MLNAIKKDFSSRAAAITMGIAAAITPLTATFAADSGEEAAPKSEQIIDDNAVQLAANTQPTATQPEEKYALIEAGNYGLESRTNVGIILYYGAGNTSTEHEIGEYVVEDLKNYASEEKGIELTPKYFVAYDASGAKGVGIAYTMGIKGLEGMDIRDGLSKATYDDVIDGRIEANEILQKADVELSMN